MPENVVQCPQCHSSRSRLFDHRTFRNQVVTNRICIDCGLVYQSPRKTPSELKAFYSAEYREIYQGSVEPTPKDVFVQIGRADSLLAMVEKVIPEVVRHLDIGCSTGILLQRFQTHYGDEPFGIEPGEAYQSYANQSGLQVFSSLEELASQESERFDLISMAHVLEHLPNPVEYLTRLRKEFLSPSGWLLLEVPNLLVHDSFEIAHLLAFTPHTLLGVIKQAGFQPIVIKKHGLPRSTLLPLYISVLAKNGGDLTIGKIIPEKYVAQKRQWGMFYRRILQFLFPNKTWQPIPNS